MSRRKPGSLTDDDLDLWRRVARSATPLDQRSRNVPLPQAEAGKAARQKRMAPSGPAQRDPLKPFEIGTSSNRGGPEHDLAPTLERSLAAQPLRMDKKVFGRLKRGKLRPERKIDLHGMTLNQAHPQLNRFISSAYADGCRLVIVVTGKGRSGRDEGGPIPTPKGVLRNQVPRWLGAPPLSAMVLQVTDAHVRHGGSGAYYVYLRRS